jgi:homoserine dehydrogenase
MQRKSLNIGLFGFGCVGYGLYQVLEKTPTLKTAIKNICVKNPDKKREISESHFTFDKNDLLNDDEINVIVELIDDADAAFEIVSTALKKGKAVVTANKKMIAEHLEELLELQAMYNVPLLYEAACCASIPIIRNLEEYYDNDLLESIEGIINGSTNYILTKTFEEGIGYSEALEKAQELGYAESNPILDTGGYDAKYKLIILILHAFGVKTKPDEIFNLGIDRLGELELNYAREKSLKIKLIAQAYKTVHGDIAAFVIPTFVSKTEKLFTVDDVFNGIITKTAFADTQFFVGKGAGAYPTASAVLSDISALSYDYRYEYKKLNNSEIILSYENLYARILLRHNTENQSEIELYFEEIHEKYANQSLGYVIGILSFAKLHDLILCYKESVSAILFDTIDKV